MAALPCVRIVNPLVRFLNFGDSIANLGYTGKTDWSQGILNWLAVRYGKPIVHEQAGHGGYTAVELSDPAFLQEIADSDATHVLVQVGTNDVSDSTVVEQVTEQQTKDAIMTIFRFIMECRKVPILMTIPPRNGSQVQLTNARATVLLNVNAWMRTTFGAQFVCDPWAGVIDALPSPIVSGADNKPWCRPGYAITHPISITGGSGYGPNTRIDITHNGGTGGELIPIIVGGVLKGARVATLGYGYSAASLPTASVVDPDGGGSGASFPMRLQGGVVDYTIGAGGSGYTNGAAITLTGGGGIAHLATVVTDGSGAIIDTVITACGFNYSSAPAVSIAGAGSGAILTPVMGSPRMWKAGMLTGDTHTGPAGAYLQAGYLLPFLPSAASGYEPLDPVTGNVLDPDFGGTGGTTGTGASGTVADNWTFSRTAGTATGAVASKAGNTQVLTLAATKTGGSSVTYTLERVITLTAAGFVAGDEIIAECEIAMSGLYGVNQIGIVFADAQGATLSQQSTFLGASSQGNFQDAALTGPFRPRTPLVVGAVNGSVDRIYVRIVITGDAANSPGGFGFTLAVGKVALRKLS